MCFIVGLGPVAAAPLRFNLVRVDGFPASRGEGRSAVCQLQVRDVSQKETLNFVDGWAWKLQKQ